MRYVPPDLDQASALWGACCGQGAIAALLRCPLAHVRRAFPWAPKEAWTSPKRAALAIEHLGGKVRIEAEWPKIQSVKSPTLLFVQILGPWMDRAPAEAHTRSHVAAFEAGMIYDVNVGRAGGWIEPSRWAAEIMPLLVDAYLDATGFQIRRHVQVLHRPAHVPAEGPFLRWDPPTRGPQLDLLGLISASAPSTSASK